MAVLDSSLPTTSDPGRRSFLLRTMAAAAAVGSPAATLWGDDSTVRLPFENGERPLVKYPQKRPLIRLTTRPPQLETPFEVFQDGVITPNDAFFVRYHLTQSPPRRELLLPGAFQLQIKGKVSKPLTFSIEELKARFENVEVVAVNQCSGNSRGFFQPRVPGGQLGNGAMGCARWRGVRLADVLKAAEPMPEAAQILLNGLDLPALPQTPDFVKSIPFDLGLSSEPVLAFEMNGEPLPWLNGFPLRLVVPGYYGTYWVKHLNEITVIDSEFKGFWMNPAYRIPDDPCAHIPPGTTAKRTIPISRLNVRSFITSPLDGAVLKAGVSQRVRGIAFDGGGQLREVAISSDNGRTWRAADLGPDAGRFAFREWTFSWSPPAPGEYSLLVRATNRLGESQPMEPLWNPSGYMRNVVEATKVTVA